MNAFAIKATDYRGDAIYMTGRNACGAVFGYKIDQSQQFKTSADAQVEIMMGILDLAGDHIDVEIVPVPAWANAF